MYFRASTTNTNSQRTLRVELYTDTIRRWAADNRRTGLLPDADGTGEVGLGEGEAGKRLAVRFTLRVRGDRAEAVRYQVFGCGFTIAACAATAELAEGRLLAEIGAITPGVIDATLAGLPPERAYCAELAVEALLAAVKSAGNGHHPVTAMLATDDDHAPRVTDTNPLYRLLIDSPAPRGVPSEDRHLFACLLAVAAIEASDIAATIGLSNDELADLLHRYFPAFPLAELTQQPSPAAALKSGTLLSGSAPKNPDLLELLLAHLPQDNQGWNPAPSLWLAKSLAARAARPGHLWISMGLFARPELTAAIRRHLPALIEANNHGMRWKRFLFKQLCERSGGTLCKTPDCGVCSDYALCFGEE